MNKKKLTKLVIFLILAIISNILLFKNYNLNNKDITLSFQLKSNSENSYQLYYGVATSWNEQQSQTVNYSSIKKLQTLKYTIPSNTQYLRFDLGNSPSNVEMGNLKLSYYGKKAQLDLQQILNKSNQNQIEKISKLENFYTMQTIGNDAYIVYKIDNNIISDFSSRQNIINNIFKSLICIAIDILILLLLRKSKSIFLLIEELKNNRVLIWDLSKNDFKTKYAGSYLGIIWAFIQPIVTILVYWFVFEFGLKAGSPLKGVPFIVWFMAGLVPWFFFQEALLNATNCMMEYSYLVKKVVFKVSILPIVKIISALFVHLVFIGFLFFVSGIYGFYPSIYTVQLIYYLLCTFILVLGLSYATSAIVIFFKDLGQIINIFLQIGMWMTPILWSYTMVPQRYQWILKLNPMYYIVEGYRDTFISHVWFYQKSLQTLYFWIVGLALFAFGAIIFKKLKPHFADVL